MSRTDEPLDQSSLTPSIPHFKDMSLKGFNTCRFIHFVLIAAALTAIFGTSPIQAKPANAKPAQELTGQALWDLTESNLFDSKIHHLYIKMNQAVWNQLHDDEKNNGCVKKDNVKWGHVRYFVLDGLVLKNVAMRVRGNTSRCIPRLQFSVAFDKVNKVYTRQGGEGWREMQYDAATQAALKNRKVHGLDELSLRRSYNDSSGLNDSGNGLLAREYTASWAAAQAEKVTPTTLRGAPVYRSVYTAVEFQLCASDKDRQCNNRFRRAYLIAEPIDKGFFRMRYDDSKPTFLSMTHGCALKGERGLTPDCLEPEYINGKKYDDQDAGQKSRLAELLTGAKGLKTHIDAAADPAALGAVLDLDSVMNYAVAAATVGHWDSAYGNFNNDILYWHEPSGKWKLITWDMDNTFDYDSPGGPARSYSYSDVAKAPRLLFDKLFGMPELDTRFRTQLGKYLTLLYGTGEAGPLKDKIQEVRDNLVGKLNAQLAPPERQDLQREKEMSDYAKERYETLTRQMGNR
ncbi:MAG: CotH kinase family protein [Methylobacter sp.]|nr:CotH kinase family protein [Methylobacter sp.]